MEIYWEGEAHHEDAITEGNSVTIYSKPNKFTRENPLVALDKISYTCKKIML